MTSTRQFQKSIMETNIPYSSTWVKQAMQHFIPTQAMQKSLTSDKSYSAILFS